MKRFILTLVASLFLVGISVGLTGVGVMLYTYTGNIYIASLPIMVAIVLGFNLDRLSTGDNNDDEIS